MFLVITSCATRFLQNRFNKDFFKGYWNNHFIVSMNHIFIYIPFVIINTLRGLMTGFKASVVLTGPELSVSGIKLALSGLRLLRQTMTKTWSCFYWKTWSHAVSLLYNTSQKWIYMDYCTYELTMSLKQLIMPDVGWHKKKERFEALHCKSHVALQRVCVPIAWRSGHVWHVKWLRMMDCLSRLMAVSCSWMPYSHGSFARHLSFKPAHRHCNNCAYAGWLIKGVVLCRPEWYVGTLLLHSHILQDIIKGMHLHWCYMFLMLNARTL